MLQVVKLILLNQDCSDLNKNPYVCKSWIYERHKLVKIVDVVFDRFQFKVYGSPEETKIKQFVTNTTVNQRSRSIFSIVREKKRIKSDS